MLVRIFKTSYTLNHLFFLVAGVMLWLPAFMHPGAGFETDHALLAGPVIGALAEYPVIGSIIALLLLFFESYFLNYVLIENNLAPRNSIFAAFMYFLLMSFDKQLLTIHPVLLANVFVIPAMNFVLRIYTSENPFAEIFNTGFLISMATLFFLPSFWLILYIWLTFIVYRIVGWREWLISVLGFALPNLFVFVWAFWSDNMHVFSGLIDKAFEVTSGTAIQSGFTGIAIIAAMALLLLFSLFGMFNKINEQKISIRKKLWSLIWLAAVSFFALIWMGPLPLQEALAITFTSIAGISSFYALQLKKALFLETLVNVIAVIVLVNNYFL